MTKVQPDISPLLVELFSLRSDTNTLLEAESALRRGTQAGVATTKSISVEDDYESATVK